MEKSSIFLDTDVILNWLTKEEDSNTGFKLWKSPYEIMKLIDKGEIIAYSSITNVFEIRFVLRRKKKCPEIKIKNFIANLFKKINIEIPDYIDMLTANRLQDNYSLDPFDSIGLGIIQTMHKTSLISRDSDFMKITKDLGIDSYTPEKFIEVYFPDIFKEIKTDFF